MRGDFGGVVVRGCWGIMQMLRVMCVRRFRAEGYTAFVLVIFDVVLLLRKFSDRDYRCSSALGLQSAEL